jgi:pimeloyl-ACP methyl ester carboxylesterase
MTELDSSFGLKQIGFGCGKHAIVLLHGIRQTREAVEAPLGAALVRFSPHVDVFVYGYNHTRALVANGKLLAETLANEIKIPRIDLVGYSMGGLVARLAASDKPNSSIHTVVTLATPNRGSLSNAELTTLGQLGRGVFDFISPMIPRSEGVKDLTRAAKIMSDRRDEILQQSNASGSPLAGKRYASIPALFYNSDTSDFKFGPSIQMTGVQIFFWLVGMKKKLLKMDKAHDGIVTEKSNNIAQTDSANWSEVHFARPGPNGEPAFCHAVIDNCRNHDHSSVLSDEDVGLLIWSIIDCADWRKLETHHPTLINRIRARCA